jgi:2-keto-3-deoxy-L-rhamnonate aldolase RhmA
MRDLSHMLRHHNRRRGLFVKLAATEVLDITTRSGVDFVVVDLEHSQVSEAEGLCLVRHAAAIGLPALVRIPELDRGAVNRLLEAGARGIQLSTVRSVAQVRALRAATRYAPEGHRSVSLAHPAAAYGEVPLPDYLESQRRSPPELVVQIETATTDDPLPELLAAGADVAFVGTTDLSVDLGLDAARVRERVEAIASAAEGAGVELGGFALDHPQVTYDIRGSDVSLLRAAVVEYAKEHASA